MSSKTWLVMLAIAGASLPVVAQVRPPPFAGGVPGVVQNRSIIQQRHQARTLLYREALEELRKNPAAADLPVCAQGTVASACLNTASQGSPQTPLPAPAPAADGPATTATRRIALLIGNNAYRPPIPALETPIEDINAVASVLEQKFGYATRRITDASQEKIIGELNRLANEITADDSVLITYAGHGYLMEDIGMGFWIPSDASVKTAKGWISNQDISKMLGAIRARQLILISDSCFSGTLTKEQKVTRESGEKTAGTVLQQRSVVVLSSGGDEPVSDEGKDGHSIFAWNLINTLRQTGVVTPGARIWETVRQGVTKDYPQEPQYGAVVSAGHVVGGDYLFLPK